MSIEVTDLWQGVCINYRDLSTVENPTPRGIQYPMSPNSDCAGVITAIAPDVTGVDIGERVISCFFQNWVDNGVTPDAMASALGGALPGVLAEQVLLSADGVIPCPDYLGDEEASLCPAPR